MSKPFALVIEDHEEQAITFQKALEFAGFDAEMVLDGERAKERLDATVPKLVVLDLHMPKVSGEMLLRQIRADERIKDTTVFLATADAVMGEGLRDQVELVLLKPVSFSQLHALAERYKAPTQAE